MAKSKYALLKNADRSLKDRGNTIIERTPMDRFGEAEYLIGTLLWLGTDQSRFVTGVVALIDGEVSAHLTVCNCCLLIIVY